MKLKIRQIVANIGFCLLIIFMMCATLYQTKAAAYEVDNSGNVMIDTASADGLEDDREDEDNMIETLLYTGCAAAVIAIFIIVHTEEERKK